VSRSRFYNGWHFPSQLSWVLESRPFLNLRMELWSRLAVIWRRNFRAEMHITIWLVI
jgi:hypothetical protein